MMNTMVVKRAMPKMACMKPSSFSSRHERGTTIRANRNRQNLYEAKHPGFAETRVSWNSPLEQIRNGPMFSRPSRSPHCAEGPEGQGGGQGDDDEEDDLEPFAQEHLTQLR